MDGLKHIKLFIIIFAIALLAGGCGKPDRELPLEKIKITLKDTPSYSIILEDMKEAGTFSKHYFHKYRVVFQEEVKTTDWMEVPKDYYKTSELLLGMSLFVKKEGEENSSVAPPGYQHVGDSRYGHWTNDHRGGSFWEFYGKYALFSSLMGGWYRPIYRTDYNAYRQHRTGNAPYFGRNNEYGTNGSVVKRNKPGFYNRRMARERMKKASFKDRVSKRTGRTRTGFRSRAGGFGK